MEPEVTQIVRCDVNLVQLSARQVITPSDALTIGGLTSRSTDGCRQFGIAQDVERLLERVEVVGLIGMNEGRPFAGDEDPVVVQFDPTAGSQR